MILIVQYYIMATFWLQIESQRLSISDDIIVCKKDFVIGNYLFFFHLIGSSVLALIIMEEISFVCIIPSGCFINLHCFIKNLTATRWWHLNLISSRRDLGSISVRERFENMKLWSFDRIRYLFRIPYRKDTVYSR